MFKKFFLFFPLLFFIFISLFLNCSKSADNPNSPSQPQLTNTQIKTISPTNTLNFFTYTPTLTTTSDNGSDYYEPDNNYTQAKNITGGEIQTRTIHT